MRCLLVIFSLWLSVATLGQPRTDHFLSSLLQGQADSLLRRVLQHPEIYRYQLIYTQIDRDANNIPSFTNYYYRFDSLQYFNPASTVKLPLAILTLEKLNTLSKYGVTMDTPFKLTAVIQGKPVCTWTQHPKTDFPRWHIL